MKKSNGTISSSTIADETSALWASEELTRRDVVQRANTLLLGAGAGALAIKADLASSAVADSLSSGPRKLRIIENLWIPMSDGTRIAARAWIPEDAERNPVPAIMEYIPYRKRDGTRLGDELSHPYLASHGYACIRPDIRGSGDSDGLPQDEYVKKEQDDGVEIIAWLARQPWCNGKVGMFGISWGGFSSLQVAARRPPALKAIITHCSTDNRYNDDCHYTGGCINEGMLTWGAMWTAGLLQSPDPAIVGAGWRKQWLQRLENLDFYLADWLTHQHYDAFWKHASISEDYSAIKCAVYAVGGWVDPYRGTVARVLANLKCPRKGLVGPWGHQYPQMGNPGPAIDWLPEALRWWDYWLKDIDTGIMKEPSYRAWMQESPAMLGATSVPGRWIAEQQWPSARIKADIYYFNGQGMGKEPGTETTRTLKPIQTVGVTAPRYFVKDMQTELPADQRIDDARSMTFDSTPLSQDLELLGHAAVTLDLAVDKPVAFLMVRLNEVGPDGVSKRLAYGILNLTHRNGHEAPEALEPGKRYRVHVQLEECAQVLKAGHCIRVAISTSYWPMIWPSPEPVTLTVYTGKSTLDLPVRPPRADDAQLKPFAAATPVALSGRTVLRPGKAQPQTIEIDVASGKQTFRSGWDSGVTRLDATGTETSSSVFETLEITGNDPTSARAEYRSTGGLKRGDWDTRTEAVTSISLTKDEILVKADMKAFDQGKQVFAKVWDRKIPRRLL